MPLSAECVFWALFQPPKTSSMVNNASNVPMILMIGMLGLQPVESGGQVASHTTARPQENAPSPEMRPSNDSRPRELATSDHGPLTALA